MFSFKRNSTPSSPSKRPTLLPPRPSFAHPSESRSNSPTGSGRRESFSSVPRSPLASPALSLSNRDRDGYFNLPLPPGHQIGNREREWTEEEQEGLRRGVIEDIKRVDEVLRLLKCQKELMAQLAGCQKDLGAALRRLGNAEGLPAAIPLALTPCSNTSTDLSLVLQKTLKNTSKELDRIETTLYKHSKAVNREYNALDEAILINDKRMAAAEKPLQNDSRSSAAGKGGIGMAHERYLRVISGLCDDSANKKRSTSESISTQHVIAISRLTASICQTYHILFEGLAEGMRAGAGKIGEIRYAGILVAENWNDDVPGQDDRAEEGDGQETVKWKRPDGQGERAKSSDTQRNVSDRPRPIGKRSMPVPPASRTSSYPSTIATASQFSSSVTTNTSASLSPRTPTDQDRPPADFDPRSTYSPRVAGSFGVLQHQPPSTAHSRPGREEQRKGHRPSVSVSDRMKQFENGVAGSHTSQASSVSSDRSGLSRPANTRPYSLPAVAPLRLPTRDPPPADGHRPRERELPRDYSRLPVPTAGSPTTPPGKGSSEGAGERVRRLSGLFERKNENAGNNGSTVQRVSTSPHSRHGTGCMCPNCYDANNVKAPTVRPAVPQSPSLRPGLPASRQSTSSIHSFSEVEVRQPSPKRLSQKIDRELAELLGVETA